MEGDGTTEMKSEQTANVEPELPAEVVSELQNAGITNPEIIRKLIIDQELKEKGDIAYLSQEALAAAGMKGVPLQRVLEKLGLRTPVGVLASTAPPGVNPLDILPLVPPDESITEALKAGGVLKFEIATVISGIRVALAYRAGLFNIPSRLVTLMEAFADSNDDPVGPEFFRLRKQVTKHEYGDLFSAIEGLDTAYVTETRKKQLLERIETFLWPAIREFNLQLINWTDEYSKQLQNPTLFMAQLFGGRAGVVPPNVFNTPSTATLRDSAKAVNDAINRVFRGSVAPIAAAMASDAKNIKSTLNDPRIPSMIGAANRDQMLKMLEAAVSPNYPRLEQNLVAYVLAVMQIEQQPSGDAEIRYFFALQSVGSQIPFDHLTSTTPDIAGIGSEKRQKNRTL
ncbi:MAG TPA: hypothetical protein P5080_00060 [Candidatus Paceibacterota bacterium]|nr:hypothetical protein [Candidatus Pacearchaeota archaeon]HRZ50367.1 hypothetical protein [Candidatus Paceibacterota bacterium]HSA36088.1 hypothetical protein [Candidatus Paceibacterota bacterium]